MASVLGARELVGEVPAPSSSLVSAGEVVGDAFVSGALASQKPSARSAGPARPGSVVPSWRSGLDAGILAVDHQRILAVLAEHHREGGSGLICRQITAATGLELTPARIEGVVRSRARRPAERRRLVKDRARAYRLAPGPAAAS
ncbi:hypothetical protein ACFYRC_18115 [Streptomyces sp. NPDC005279]|uniref:hypothetical protein n=1 Tax=Streptomyces sp. NPDC005279 TaxID=3364712 RepID=UPI00367D5EA5